MLALIPHITRPLCVPLQPRPLQPLHPAAARTRHIEPPLIAAQVLRLDPAEVLHRWRAGQQDLPTRECRRPPLGQCHRVALAVHIARKGVHLVSEQVAARRRSQTSGAVGPGQQHDPAGELLREHRVARVPRPGRSDLLRQHWRLRDHRLKPLLAQPLRHLHRRLHAQHRTWRVVDHITQPVAARLGLARLRRKHHHHPLHQAAAAQAVHWLA